MTVTAPKAIGNTTVFERSTAPRKTTKATAPVIILISIISPFLNAAKPTLSLLEVFYDGIYVVGGKIGPKLIGKIKLGIG